MPKKTKVIDTSGETLSPEQAATLLGFSRTKFWRLLHRDKKIALERIAWSTEERPRYRREDVLALKHATPPLSQGDMERLAREAADAADRAERGE
jgi:hypothetical protein